MEEEERVKEEAAVDKGRARAERQLSGAAAAKAEKEAAKAAEAAEAAEAKRAALEREREIAREKLSAATDRGLVTCAW